MFGRKLYNYALTNVPGVVKKSLDKAGLDLADVKKVFLHQANAKMDEAILKRLFKLYKVAEIPDGIMPMSISWLGNSSVATVPTLLDLVVRGRDGRPEGGARRCRGPRFRRRRDERQLGGLSLGVTSQFSILNSQLSDRYRGVPSPTLSFWFPCSKCSVSKQGLSSVISDQSSATATANSDQ